ncbi:Protein of unknown function [Desulfonispora thiosulfatigenes DSM 11270]|uniref:DUF4127 family protein n=1 Tax=Desulfonispora thiosulfatigenes DSM 11270 TaxID=656914 RepID=A0A1W1V4F6_DESTI|nr:DUF4127 family protein [Desulfonispora thiosulfatigenes]SMB88228.1 Protein of unknown function [Desulfonispora thiosulfatigenes DSM 11270]
MKKKFLITLLPLILIFSIVSLYCLLPKKPVEIALIPLDSRPCNTQYAQILGTMGNLKISIPYSDLDNYLEKANKEQLWQWLAYKAEETDNIIINTTELFNGGLIESRNPDSYNTLNDDLKRLEDFCRKHPDHNIMVITILPRLLPSQFTDMWEYKWPLSHYASELDKAYIQGEKIAPPKNIPSSVLSEYLSIYENAQNLTTQLISLAKEGIFDTYLIGQDDAEEYGLTNKLVRDLEKDFGGNVHFVYGADELTLLALTKFYLAKPQETFKLNYINEELKKEFLPFEAITLENVVNNKLKFLEVETNLDSNHQEVSSNNPKDNFNTAEVNYSKANKIVINNNQIVYNDLEKRDFLLQEIARHTGYLGIMDVVYTNRGDSDLYLDLIEENLLKNIEGYAGWNTASNTIGTELAHFYFYQHLKDNYKHYTKEAKIKALESYLEFKYLRFAEDFIFQGILQSELNEILKAQGLDPFSLENHKQQTEEILQKLFIPYQQELAKQLLGEYSIGEINFIVKKIDSEIKLPWARTFEAKVNVSVDLEVTK